MAIDHFLDLLGDPVTDVDEECFIIFSQVKSSHDLGFVDAKASTLDMHIGNQDFTIEQCPGLLKSDRKEGTTGAVLWNVTPLIAKWLNLPSNYLFSEGVLGPTSQVLELGCGVSGVLALTVAPKVGRYIASDQAYVMKTLKMNIQTNVLSTAHHSEVKGRKTKNQSSGKASRQILPEDKITTVTLDWEHDHISGDLLFPDDPTGTRKNGLDAVIACDCIYNESLIEPFVDTCVDACQLRDSTASASNPTICIIAQQLRSPDVFEAWLRAFHRRFRVWRVPDSMLMDELKIRTGFVAHVGILRDVDGPER
ncbi:MAG: hypothetical protein M1823_000038 [Watsoniomyces obsoletus]|nr:MAG: hypothetical protein M1823_000038 [Watsoniomyces obsoletus]